jgi:hypothetical protein
MYNTPAYKTARGLGWFSLALGAAEILAPGSVNRALGFRQHRTLVRGFGIRELLSGAGILLSRNPIPWLWARVAGDVLDMAALLPGLSRRNRQRGAVTGALFSVAAVTFVDYLCARNLGDQLNFRNKPRRDYSARSGLNPRYRTYH